MCVVVKNVRCFFPETLPAGCWWRRLQSSWSHDQKTFCWEVVICRTGVWWGSQPAGGKWGCRGRKSNNSLKACRLSQPPGHLTQCKHSVTTYICQQGICKADSRLAPSQWETSLQSNAVSHWLGGNLESALFCTIQPWYQATVALQWRHNGRDSVSNHQPHHCLLNRLFSADLRKHQSSVSLAFVQGIHRWPVNSPHKWPVTWKMFPFDDVIMSPWKQLGCHFANNIFKCMVRMQITLFWFKFYWNHYLSLVQAAYRWQIASLHNSDPVHWYVWDTWALNRPNWYNHIIITVGSA